MGIRKKLFALLRDSPRRDNEGVGSTVPQPRSSESTPPNLQGRKPSDGERVVNPVLIRSYFSVSVQQTARNRRTS